MGLLREYIENNKSLSQFREIIHTKKLTTILSLWRSNVGGKMEKTLGVLIKAITAKTIATRFRSNVSEGWWSEVCEGRLGLKNFPQQQWVKEYIDHRKVRGRLPGFEHLGLIFPTSTCYRRLLGFAYITSYAEHFCDRKCTYSKVFPWPIMNVCHCISIPLYWMCALDFPSFIMDICRNVSLV